MSDIRKNIRLRQKPGLNNSAQRMEIETGQVDTRAGHVDETEPMDSESQCLPAEGGTDELKHPGVDRLNTSAVSPGMHNRSQRKSKRKSHRRSSFITGRITKSFCAPETTDLLKCIPADLPPEKRLEVLHYKAMEHVLNCVEESLPDLPNFAEFRIKALDSAETAIKKLSEEGVFIKATTPPEMLENDEQSVTLETHIQETEAAITRLNAESENWDEVLAEYTRLAEEAERLQKESTRVEMSSPPPSLTKSQQAVLDNRVDVKSLYTELRYLCEKQVLSMDAVKYKVALHEELLKETDRQCCEKAKEIACRSFPEVVFTADPKKLIHDKVKELGDTDIKRPERDPKLLIKQKIHDLNGS